MRDFDCRPRSRLYRPRSCAVSPRPFTEPAQSGVAAYQEGAAVPPNRVWTESSMTRRRSLILSIVTAGCWIILLAIVLGSVFEASTLTKQTRNKDGQSVQLR
jgi:hypothetical protein